MNKEIVWGNITKYLVFCLVTFGGGEIYSGIINHHVQSSWYFILLSLLLFVARFFYALYSGAKESILAEVYGIIVMLVLFIAHLYYN